MSTPAFTLHTSFSPLLSLYDAFLLDQFGVIHNGSQSLHGAVDCIKTMVAQKKKLAILSNTSSPSHVALNRLKKYGGLSGDMFAGGLVSSGEECAKFIRENYCNNEDGSKAKKALWFTWKESESQNPMQFLSYCESGDAAGDGNFSDGRGVIDIAESVEEADFILLHGSEVWRRCRETNDNCIQDLHFLYEEDYTIIDQVLERSSELGLPMVCANPDYTVGLPGGVVGNMPGKIAERYSKKGGAVRHFGKPNPRHFHACLENLGIKLEPNAMSIPGVAHVGDSLEHDVAGANAAGIDSIFVLGGIHARELNLIPTGTEDAGFVVVDEDETEIIDQRDVACSITKNELHAKLEAFFSQKCIWPTHVVPSLHLVGAVDRTRQ